VGVLNLTDKKNRRLFDEFEMHVLSSIINHVTGIYRNYSDRRSEEKRRRLMQEVKIASEIQRKNLARIPRCSGGLSIAVLYEPAREVGGDFFDFYEISDAIAAFLIADVSGKGIPAALFTGTVKNILRAEQKTNYEPVSLFSGSNMLICSESEYGMFVTAFYVIIDENGERSSFHQQGIMSRCCVRETGQRWCHSKHQANRSVFQITPVMLVAQLNMRKVISFCFLQMVLLKHWMVRIWILKRDSESLVKL
jgi:serine phosphatase RsbU (regulator of sigma subunit)